jgi:hypothetical protein
LARAWVSLSAEAETCATCSGVRVMRVMSVSFLCDLVGIYCLSQFLHSLVIMFPPLCYIANGLPPIVFRFALNPSNNKLLNEFG